MSSADTKIMLTRRSLLFKGAITLGGAMAAPGTVFAQASLQTSRSTPPDRIPLRVIVVDSLVGARQILDRLNKGESFASLAMERSLDPTANQGGYLGVLNPAELRPELRDALKGIAPGQVSPIVRIPEGYAILKIDRQPPGASDDRNPNRLLSLTGPGAVRYGPEVDGLGEEEAAFHDFPYKPEGWNRNLVSIAEIHQKSVPSAIKRLQGVLDPASLDDPPADTAIHLRYLLAQLYAFQGDMAKAIEQWRAAYGLSQSASPQMVHYLEAVLGIAHLHKSEMENGVYRNPGEKCLFPMSSKLSYSVTGDSQEAAERFLNYLSQDRNDLEAKWLLNLACMTLGKYPAGVPEEFLFPLTGFQSKQSVGRFVDVAPDVGLTSFSDCGGIIVDDFENRGLFDVVVSSFDAQASLRYFRNNGDGTFTDRTQHAGLENFFGGLNIIQTDYNNDGCLDVLVLRGAWEYPQPMSLLQGNGDGTFTDVTRQAGLTDLISTQTAAWADIDNDGLLDLFVGNERGPSHLFLNKGNGTFEDISGAAGVDRIAFTKGVVAEDYDNDGYVDFYVTNIGSSNFLYHNERNGTFREVAREADVRDPFGHSFATWFFDYDNDGWPDLFTTSYYTSIDETLRTYLGLPHNAVTLKLYKSMRDGTFDDVTNLVGLDKVFMPMGANFGDIDNDGFLDIYLGTGNPSYGALVPNVLLRNDGGRRFVDVTALSGTGELHKGHGVAFADMSHAGHEDILTVIGGATPGDRHAFRFFKNPGNANNWITLKLVGAKTNRAALGARIAITVKNEGRGPRSIYRTVGSGGSFGANPLEQHIGLGPSARIEKVEIWWPVSNTRQTFSSLHTNQFIEIKEFAGQYEKLVRRKLPMRPPQGAAAVEVERDTDSPDRRG